MAEDETLAPLPDVGPLRRVHGPVAVGPDPGRVWRLAYTLASTDFKLKFFGSVLGYIWQLLNPLLLFGVLFLVFSLALKLGKGAAYYPVALLLGIVLFTFLSESTGQAVRSLVAREPLVRKVDFPRFAVPLATVLAASFNLGLNLVVVLIFLVVAGAPLLWGWLLFPVVVAVLVIFALGLSTLLATAYVRFRDVDPIWSVILQIVFYASGVFFTFDAIAKHEHGQLLVDLLLFNPFAALLGVARHVLLGPTWPLPWDAMSSPWLIVIPATLIVVTCVAGVLIFRRRAPAIAEEL